MIKQLKQLRVLTLVIGCVVIVLPAFLCGCESQRGGCTFSSDLHLKVYVMRVGEEEWERIGVTPSGSPLNIPRCASWSVKPLGRVDMEALAREIATKKIPGLWLYDWPATDTDLAHLQGLTGLQWLALNCTKITDAGLAHLKGLTGLQWLDLSWTKISDVGLVHLKGMTKLQMLSLAGTKITDAGLVHLKGMTELQTLDLGGTDITDAGLAHLKGLTKLDLSYTKITDAGLTNLKELTELRELDVSSCDDIKNIAFVAGMKYLRFLDLSQSSVSDLSPLGGLPKLERVIANDAPIAKLPKQRVPALRRLHILSSPTDLQVVREFRKAHPKSIVAHGWNDTLHRALKKVTRIRVRTGSARYSRSNRDGTLFEVKDAKEIKAFLANIRVNEPSGRGDHLCSGRPTIEFYEGKKLVVSLDISHGMSLRWPGVWPRSATLVFASVDYIAKWFADHGINGISKYGDGPHHIMYLIDRSGSMFDIFDEVKHDIAQSVGRLVAQDFHVIMFADGQPFEKTPKALTPPTEKNKIALAGFLKKVKAEGTTDPVKGITRAFDVLDKADKRPGKIIYLLADGGFPDNTAVIAAIRARNAKKDVVIHAFLYGKKSPVAVKVMSQIAKENGGVYRYINPAECSE